MKIIPSQKKTGDNLKKPMPYSEYKEIVEGAVSMAEERDLFRAMLESAREIDNTLYPESI